MKLNKYDMMLGSLILAEVALCIYIGLSGANSYLCAVGSDCESVQNSIYGTLFGIKLAWFGAISFGLLFLLFIVARLNKKDYWMFFIATIIGAIFAVYFIYLQAFVLGKLCRDCIIIDSIMILMFVIVVFEFIDFKKEIIQMEKSAEKVIKKAI